ncbi:uncharacterized protein BT62DRAFT_115643 [Guyanagaster necrorhizus]|uniref:Uncharacterized protein n=1 Tax=Guyanagaster necrorhizus TaxID=856835 RepID=A0A9P7VTL1_9AGAR|nr:uncharacterized protein BT62DRAFT_115643 [Guyanagaster necrorhizus MCA 3950]KAG7446378.1 hypothetical protein BT62DRAFT_115643 [Guyanagaster necrorhizus MCA 3950]
MVLFSPPENERAGLREVMSEHQDVTKIMREYDRWWCRHLDRNNQLEHLRRVTVNAEIRQSDFNSQPAKERQDVSGSESSMIFHPLTDSWSPSPRNSRTKPFEQIRKSQNQSVVKTTVSAQRPKASSGTAPILTKFARKIADSLDVGGSEPGDTSLHLSLPTRTQRPKKTVVPNRIVKSKSPLLSLDRSDVMVNPENRSHIYLSSPPSQMPLSRKSATQSAAFSPKHSTTFTDIQSHNLPSSFTLGHDGFLSSPSPGSSHGSVSRLLAADRVRKVPPSAQPNHLPINSQSTPKILAPNSDTSSQPFSQSQLQSQSWVHSQSQSQECPPSQLHPLFSQSLSQSQSELHSQLSYDLQPNVSAQFSAEVKPHSEPSLRLPQPFSQSFAPSGVSQHADVTQAVNLPPRSEQDAGDIDEHDSLFSADDYDDDLYRTRSSTRENTENGSLSVNPPDTQNDMDVDGLSDETSESDLESDKQSSMKCSNGQKHDGSDTESPNTGIKLDSDDFQTQTDLFGSLQKSQLQMAVRSRREKKRVSLGFDDLEEPTLSVSCSRASIIHHSPSAWAAPSFMRQTVAHESAEPLGSRSNYIRPDDTTRQQDKIVLGAPQRGNPQKSRPTTRIIGETLDEISRTRKKDTIATTRQTLPREDADNQMEGSVGMKRPSGNNQPHRPLKRGKRNASQSISAFGSGSAHTHTKLLGFSVALDKTGLQNVVSWSRMKNIILNTGKYQSVLRE